MLHPISRLVVCAFFLLLSFSVLNAQNKAGKDRFAAYQQLYAQNESGESAGLPMDSMTGSDASSNFSPFPNAGSSFPAMGVPGFGQTAPALNVTAKALTLPDAEKPGELEIATQIPPGFKIYSLTQEKGGPFPTKIYLADGILPDGDFVPAPAPKAEKDEDVWGDFTIESHENFVKWNVKFNWKDPKNPPAQISGSVEAQMCDANSCLPPKKFPFTAPVPQIKKIALPTEQNTDLSLPESQSTAEIPVEEQRIAVQPVAERQGAEQLTANRPTSGRSIPEMQFLENKTQETQNLEIQIPAKTSEKAEAPGKTQSSEASDGALNSPGASAEESEAMKNGKSSDTDPVQENPHWNGGDFSVDYSLAIILLMAYLGGLILNLMPCVLPVIAPKLHSFVRQAGEARLRIFLLNVSYSLGLLTVLWILAILSRIADLTALLKEILPSDVAAKLPEFQNMGWGQQFTYPGFVIFMIALVFVMGLSFLGVWEIPIPGMISSGKLGKMQKKEGFLGAYCMGILTTLLATPCVGPYLGPVFGWSMTQPVWTSFLAFTVIGLGLGTPYLVIGACPFMIRFLPKPGEWMETLKEVMGFFFLGTVVWLFYVLPGRFTVPVLGLLVALWFSCWLIGKNTLSGASRESILAAWVSGIIFTLLVGFILFSMDLSQVNDEENETTVSVADGIPWEKFSFARVEELRKSQKIIFIDFTARWCATCQTNTKFAIETPKVEEFVKSNEIAPLLADWTEPSEEIKSYLERMGRNSIPLIVIWIPGKEQPVLIDGLVSESKLLSALQFSVENAK